MVLEEIGISKEEQAAAKARERYSSVENPDSEAISFTGRDVAARSRLASSIRASAIAFCTVVDRHLRKDLSTRVREKPICLKTSDADMPLAALSRMKDVAFASQCGAFG